MQIFNMLCKEEFQIFFTIFTLLLTCKDELLLPFLSADEKLTSHPRYWDKADISKQGVDT